MIKTIPFNIHNIKNKANISTFKQDFVQLDTKLYPFDLLLLKRQIWRLDSNLIFSIKKGGVTIC